MSNTRLNLKYSEGSDDDIEDPLMQNLLKSDATGEEGISSNSVVQRPGIMGILINFFVMVLTLFLGMLFGFYTVAPQQHVLIIFFGKLVKVQKNPGLHWYWPFGRSTIAVPICVQTLDIKKSTVVDQNGNPIVVAGVVTFNLVNTTKAALDVKSYEEFLSRQSLAVLKKSCSMYPYEARNGKSLQSESGEVSALMVRLLQRKADLAGANIISFELADLQYAPEIASGMLVRQQAQALVDARKVIVDGAVSIVMHAISNLSECGITLKTSEQSRLISNLLAVICSDAHVQPVLSLTEGVNEEDTAAQAESMHQMIGMLQKIAANTTPKG
eukprot:TRINITY_DN16691_c0_g1_i1.p1 TRINITY_DN16691_c0_g1~~TRINITY_DN16691_c0_g1_i1.p1  ORF type:complete len:344 (+),score=50.47 TRINITY_DN16691_c0_g1_i1:49-1032(+)